MDVYTCIKERRSVRKYIEEEVKENTLNQVLDAARRAPSANNRQHWKFVVVKDAQLRKKLAKAARGQKFVAEAPVVIAACAIETTHIMSCGHPSHLIDLSIALDHMTLAARELELGTCWIGAFDQSEVKAILGIPEAVEVVELLTLGYPAQWPSPTSRRPLEDIVSIDGWG